jgi:hypothetical protein
MWYPPTEKRRELHYATVPPDVLNDLNAMHEAEKVLLNRPLELGIYIIEVGRAVDKTEVRQKDHNFSLITATATQRAEAFLRTLGLWKDDASNLSTVDSTTASINKKE